MYLYAIKGSKLEGNLAKPDKLTNITKKLTIIAASGVWADICYQSMGQCVINLITMQTVKTQIINKWWQLGVGKHNDLRITQ